MQHHGVAAAPLPLLSALPRLRCRSACHRPIEGIRTVGTAPVTSLAAGESVVAVAERLGHENASLVMGTYGHLMPDSEDHTRKAINGAWTTGAVAAQTPTAHGRPG